jgi:hypothetical protein
MDLMALLGFGRHVPVLFWKAVEFRVLFHMKCSLQCPQCVPSLLLICSLFYFIFFAKFSISYSHSSLVFCQN